jgi:hypothetical protein
MDNLKPRLFALLLILVSIGLICWNWYQLNTEGTYSIKLAAFAPLCLVGGVFLFLFPGKGGKPEKGSDKVVMLIVFVVGLLVGLVNWFLMDPGFFGMGK